MDYSTEALDFLEPPDAFLAACDGAEVRRVDGAEVELADLLGSRQEPVIVVLTPPL